MADRPIVWADQAINAYLALPPDRQTLIDHRLRELAADPAHHAVVDPVWGWWTTDYAEGTGFLTYIVSRHGHLIIVRLVDAS